MFISFQMVRVRRWLKDTFGPAILTNVEERALRFGEEALELIQADGVSKEQALALVEQVYSKPEGEPMQELGGVMVCLLAYATVTNRSIDQAFETEMERVEEPAMQARIRQKHATKAVVSAPYRQEYGHA
jgi:NTP pyrophosphatase (non-canonical NTP hydrolase)